jgi:hypothetical protein
MRGYVNAYPHPEFHVRAAKPQQLPDGKLNTDLRDHLSASVYVPTH